MIVKIYYNYVIVVLYNSKCTKFQVILQISLIRITYLNRIARIAFYINYISRTHIITTARMHVGIIYYFILNWFIDWLFHSIQLTSLRTIRCRYVKRHSCVTLRCVGVYKIFSLRVVFKVFKSSIYFFLTWFYLKNVSL